MNRAYGLGKDQLAAIVKTMSAFSKIQSVILFGSRAKGNYREGSDIDLDIVGNEMKLDDLLSLRRKLDELNLPWNFDLLLHHKIKDTDVLNHIARVGIEIFQSEKQLDHV